MIMQNMVEEVNIMNTLFENLQLLKLNESSKYHKYSYNGLVYKFGRVIGEIKEPIYTDAPSIEKAKSNIIYRIKKLYGYTSNSKLEIDEDNLIEIPNEEDFEIIEEPTHEPLVNDPKYNFDDSDREDNYTIESKI